MIFDDKEVPNMSLSTDSSLFIKREDLLHPFVSGNKYRKLKYNVLEARKKNMKILLTFGGAFSNHLVAVASVGHLCGFKTVGIVRGEEVEGKVAENPTLSFAQEKGMELVFVSRSVYRTKADHDFIASLRGTYGDFYLIPEGGTNELAVKGCEEILTEADRVFDYVCCAVGTGGTFLGLAASAAPHQKIVGFSVLKGDFLTYNSCIFAKNKHWDLISAYHFGGYGKVTSELIVFMNWFYRVHKIPLDPVYTGKMVFGVLDLIKKGYFAPQSKILLIHTGGLQGIAGMNSVLVKKQLPKIDYDV